MCFIVVLVDYYCLSIASTRRHFIEMILVWSATVHYLGQTRSTKLTRDYEKNTVTGIF